MEMKLKNSLKLNKRIHNTNKNKKVNIAFS